MSQLPTCYVLDASAAVPAFVNGEEHTEHARELIAALLTGEIRLVIPDLFLLECANVFWKRWRQDDDLTLARSRLGDIQRLSLERVSTEHLVGVALELALRHELSVYDATYVALAMRERCALITADRRLLARLGDADVRGVHLADWRAAE